MEPRILVTILIQTAMIMLSVIVMTKITVRARKTPAFWSYVVIQTNLLIWMFGVFMGTVASTKHLYDIYVMVQFAGLFMLPFGWLLFCKSFRDGVFPQKTYAYSLVLVNVLLFVLLLTNNFHELLIKEILLNKIELGVFFWLVVGLISLEFFTGLWLLIKGSRQEGRKKGTHYLAISGLFAFGVAILSVNSEYSYPLYLIGIIPFCMFIGFIQYTWKDTFIDLSAGAFDVFMDSIRETILIFDEKGKLIESNSMSLADEFSFEGIMTLKDFREIIMEHRFSGNIEIIENTKDSGGKIIREEIGLKISNNKRAYFTIGLTQLGKARETMGTVITLRDISQQKALERDLEHKNSELKRINSKLYDYLAIAHQLEEEKERNQIAVDINSMIGQNIAEILTVLEGLHCSGDDDKIKVGDKLEVAIRSCRLVLDRIRQAVAKLLPTKTRLE